MGEKRIYFKNGRKHEITIQVSDFVYRIVIQSLADALNAEMEAKDSLCECEKEGD